MRFVAGVLLALFCITASDAALITATTDYAGGIQKLFNGAVQSPTVTGDPGGEAGAILQFTPGDFSNFVNGSVELTVDYNNQVNGGTWEVYQLPAFPTTYADLSGGTQLETGSILSPSTDPFEVNLNTLVLSPNTSVFLSIVTDGTQNVFIGDETTTASLTFQADSVSAVPEPGSLAVLGISALGLMGGAIRRRRRAKA